MTVRSTLAIALWALVGAASIGHAQAPAPTPPRRAPESAEPGTRPGDTATAADDSAGADGPTAGDTAGPADADEPANAGSSEGDTTAPAGGAEPATGAAEGDTASDTDGDDALPPADAPDEQPVVDEPLPEGHEPRITIEVDTGDGVRTGDLVEVVITATVPEGDDVTIPEQDLAPFEVQATEATDEPVDGERRRYRFALSLLVLEPGDLALPAIRVRVVTPDGHVGSVHTEPQTVEVGSYIANEPDAQPRPPSEPVQVFEDDYTLAWILGSIGALLLTALLGFLFARWWQRRPKAAPAPPPPRAPWEWAIEEIAKMRASKTAILAEHREVELVDRVSDVLRDYLGRRYDFNGLESTSDEVVAHLVKIKLRGVKREEITALLADSDLVKFARAVPDEAQCDRMLDGVEGIVRATTPRAHEIREANSRIVTKEGEISLPLSVHTMAEAEREIRLGVEAAARDIAQNPAYEGTIRVALSPELPASEQTARELTALHAAVASAIAPFRTASGRALRLVFEHYHQRTSDAHEAGRPAMRTVIDANGARVEAREQPPTAASAKSLAPKVAVAEAVASATPVAPSETRSKPTDTETNRDGTSTGEIPIVEIAQVMALQGRRIDAGPEAFAPTETVPQQAPSTPPIVAKPAVAVAASSPTPNAVAPSAAIAPDARPIATAAPMPAIAAPAREPVSTTTAGSIPTTGMKPTTAVGIAGLAEAVNAARIASSRPPAATSSVVPVSPTASPAVSVASRSSTSTDRRTIERIVLPELAITTTDEGALLRWTPGIEHPLLYRVGDRVLTVAELDAVGLTRKDVHEAALANLRRTIPASFAPRREAALLDDETGRAMIVLPELVPVGEAWIAYVVPGEGLFVMNESASSTPDELTRLRAAATAPTMKHPVRITKRGIEPFEWPSSERTTNPGFGVPGNDDGGES